jgi:hypothetical protein
MGSADVEAQKTLARGLKEGIVKAEPQIAGLNEQESKLIKTLNVAERRALMQVNNNPAGMAWLTHDPKRWAAFVADKSSLFKSLLARMLYSGAEEGSKTAGQVGGVSLYGLSKLTPLSQAQ